MSSPLTPGEVAARLDRLPVGRFHRRFLTWISLGAWFDYYDNFVAGTLAVALAHAAAFTAVPVAALLARLLAPHEAPQGWWLLLVLGSLGALLTWYFRRRLPESPRWSAQTGRHAEAEATLKRIEAAVERE